MPSDNRRPSSNRLLVPTSWGALIDRITILEIKQEHARDHSLAAIIRCELKHLCAIRDENLPENAKIDALVAELSSANRRLWKYEDTIRRHESRMDFGPTFVAVARAIYQENDRRSRIKKKVDYALASELYEIKIYENA